MDIGILNLLSRVAVVADGDQQEGKDNELLNAEMFRDVMDRKLGGEGDAATNAKRLGEFLDHIPTVLLLPEEKANLEAGLTEPEALLEGLAPEVTEWLVNTVETLTGADQPLNLIADVETIEVIDAEEVPVEVLAGVEAVVPNPHAVDVEHAPTVDEQMALEEKPDVQILPVEVEKPEMVPSTELRDMMKSAQQDDAHLVLEEVQDDVVIADELTNDLVDIAPQEVMQAPVVQDVETSEELSADATVGVVPTATATVDVDGAPEPVLQGQSPQRVQTELPATDNGKIVLPNDVTADGADDADVDLDELVQRILDRRTGTAEKPQNEFAKLVVDNAHNKTAAGSIQDIATDMAKTSGSDDANGTVQHSGHSASAQQQASERLSHTNLLRASQFAELMDDTTPSEQVKVSIKQAFKAGIDRLVIQLDPADLGRVEVRMEISSEGRNHIVISADNRDTLDLLQRDARVLERALQESCLVANADDMEFNLSQREASDGEGDGSMPNGAYSEAGEEAHEPELYLDPYTGYYTITLNEGLDIKV